MPATPWNDIPERRPQPIPCPPPSRTRYAEQIVELFLHAWQSGRYTHDLDWLPRNRRNAEAIASDARGERLAVAHTRIFALESPGLDGNALAPLAKDLEADPRLDLAHTCFNLRFHPNFLGKALSRHRDLVRQALLDWAAGTLPALGRPPQLHHFAIPVSLPFGKAGRIRLEVEVSQRPAGRPAIQVGAYLPDDPQRLPPVLHKALRNTLSRLTAAPADRRVLLIEIRAADSDRKIIHTLRALAGRLPMLARVEALVFAHTSAFQPDRCVVFRAWQLAGEEPLEIVQPVVTGPPAVTASGPLTSLTEQAKEYAAAAKAENTLRAYAADWADFRNWCEGHRLAALPAVPETVALYLTDRTATLKTSSLARRLTTINRAHEAAGHRSPATMQNAVVSEVWKGIRRKKGIAEEGKKPLLTLDLKRLLGQLPDDLQGARDRALLLAGFAGGFRRSELAGLRMEDLKETPEGMVAMLRKSKTDQEGQGRPVALPYGSDPLTCPVRALKRWLEMAGIGSGPLFRGIDQFGLVSDRALCPDSVAWIVKRATGRAGLNAREYAGHSLRAGLATQAAMNGAGELAIMKQTGHRSLATVRKYIRDGALFRDNAATKLGL